MAVTVPHSHIPSNGSPTTGKCQDCGMEEQKHEALREVSFHFQKNEEMVRKSPAMAGALKGE